MILEEWIPGTPRPQGNPQQITKNYHRYPSTTVEHRNNVIRHLGDVWNQPPIDGPVKLMAAFSFQRPKAHYGTGRNSEVLKLSAPVEHIQTPDTDKLLRLLCDALTIAGVIVDDRLIVAVVGRKCWADGQPGTLLRVTTL